MLDTVGDLKRQLFVAVRKKISVLFVEAGLFNAIFVATCYMISCFQLFQEPAKNCARFVIACIAGLELFGTRCWSRGRAGSSRKGKGFPFHSRELAYRILGTTGSLSNYDDYGYGNEYATKQ